MYGWLIRLMIRRAVRRLNAGDTGPLLAGYSRDATLVFPGETSWSGEYRGKDEIKGFLKRFVEARLRLEPEQIVVTGMPWDITVCLRFTDTASEPDGTVVYRNRGVIFAKAAWGKLVRQELYEDTQAVAAFDEYLASRERSRGEPSAAP